MSRLFLSLTVVVALFSSASAGAQRSDTLVKMAGAPLHSGVAALAEEMSIGALNGPEEYTFGIIADLAVGRDGSFIIYDRQIGVVRQYDAAGKFLRTFGRRGEGPGEYQAVSGIGLLPDGRVLVWETKRWMMLVFTPAGVLDTTWRTVASTNSSFVAAVLRGMQVDSAGFIYLKMPVPFTGTYNYLRFSPSGRLIDTLAKPPFPRDARKLEASRADARHASDLPFDAKPILRISPLGYMVTGLPERYAFELLAPVAQAGRAVTTPAAWRPGQPIVSIRRNMRAEPVTARERDSARAEVLESMRRLDPAWRWSGPEIPSTKPAFTDLKIGRDGRVWVPVVPEVSHTIGTAPSSGNPGGFGGSSGNNAQQQPPASTLRPKPRKPPRPALYDVFEPSGVYLGQVQIPARTTVVEQRGDHVWAIAWDEDDVPSVKRFRIVWR